jgi:hypothetical protein
VLIVIIVAGVFTIKTHPSAGNRSGSTAWGAHRRCSTLVLIIIFLLMFFFASILLLDV